MDDLPNPRHNWRHVIEVVAPVAVFLLLAAGILLSSYAGRQALRDNLLAGCIRSTEDRVTSAYAWRNAAEARTRAYEQSHHAFDRVAAARFTEAALGHEGRAGVVAAVSPDDELSGVLDSTRGVRVAFCQSKFPEVSFVTVR